ncbi:MAG: TolC family protein [Nitrospirota bacterium]
MKAFFAVMWIILLANSALAETERDVYTLSEVIGYAMKNNPTVILSQKNIQSEAVGIKAAKAAKMPKVDFNTGVTRYRYPTAITPITGSPLEGADFPDFDNTLYDIGAVFRLSLYKGGQLDRGVLIAEMKKAIAEDNYRLSRQELVFNLSNVYYKIAQLEKLLEANEATVKQLESHKKDVELFIIAGTVPQVELLKTELELSHAKERSLFVRNNLESAYELLKTLMGIDDMNRKISVVHETVNDNESPIEENIIKAFSDRPDYRAIMKKQKVIEERIKYAEGKGFPDIYLAGEYTDKAGEDLTFKENWALALRLTIPIFDGGSIKTEAEREKIELEKVKEDERALRLEIIREIKDAHINIENARERIKVSNKAIETAKENLRIERLKYETGAGTSTDVIDAQTSVLRADTDYYQAVFDKNIAITSLKKAIGEDEHGEVLE